MSNDKTENCPYHWLMQPGKLYKIRDKRIPFYPIGKDGKPDKSFIGHLDDRPLLFLKMESKHVYSANVFCYFLLGKRVVVTEEMLPTKVEKYFELIET